MTLARPQSVYIDGQRCIRCGVCEQIVPGLLSLGGGAGAVSGALSGPLPANLQVDDELLDAMSACPTAAIRWSEGDS